ADLLQGQRLARLQVQLRRTRGRAFHGAGGAADVHGGEHVQPARLRRQGQQPDPPGGGGAGQGMMGAGRAAHEVSGVQPSRARSKRWGAHPTAYFVRGSVGAVGWLPSTVAPGARMSPRVPFMTRLPRISVPGDFPVTSMLAASLPVAARSRTVQSAMRVLRL